jgi:hypothetical protein
VGTLGVGVMDSTSFSPSSTIINDLQETFDNLDRYKLKLNLTKCSFGVPAGQLLRFLVSARGIVANPEKNQAILTMTKPMKSHEIKQLAGWVEDLSRFVARLGEKHFRSMHLRKYQTKSLSGQRKLIKHFLTSIKCCVGRTQRKGASTTIRCSHASDGKHGIDS